MCYRILRDNHVSPQDILSPIRERPSNTFPDLERLVTPPSAIKNVETRKIRKKPGGLDLQNEQAFPPLQGDVQRKRRINPTPLPVGPSPSRTPNSNTPVRHGGAGGSPFCRSQEQAPQRNLDQERQLLKERKKESSPKTPTASASKEPVLNGHSPSVAEAWTCVEPELAAVTDALVLDRISRLHAFCLENHLTLTYFSEVRFLLELLQVRLSPLRQPPTDRTGPLLQTVHQCVYLAARTLQHLEGWWEDVDGSTLRLLASNRRLAAFAPQLTARLADRLTRLETEATQRGRLQPSTAVNVAFQMDTDNRFNFASDASFHAFRKQRDQFCELWSLWKLNAGRTADWDAASALQKRVQSLVDLHRDVVNYVHLARLFRCQLLNVARLVDADADDADGSEDAGEESSGPLGLLQSSDPLKLRRLRERLVAPADDRHNAAAVFDGDQEFFRQFILLADSPAFNYHLADCLVGAVDELSATPGADQDSDADADTRPLAHLTQTVISLRVLAKFLALITFGPHQTVDHLPEHVFHQLSQLRTHQMPAIGSVSFEFTNSLIGSVPN